MKPIIFSGEMVNAILDGRKTQTRRVMNPQPFEAERLSKLCWVWSPKKGEEWYKWDNQEFDIQMGCLSPYGNFSNYEYLWVRETWRTLQEYDDIPPRELPENTTVQWKADMRTSHIAGAPLGKWRPSIYMPKWGSRITLQIHSIRAERVQDITPDDILAEGVTVQTVPQFFNYRDTFIKLWDSINVKRGYAWEINPWVWVIEFEMVKNWIIEQHWEDWQNE